MGLELDLDLRLGSFHLRLATNLAGPATGIAGASGSGKTTLLHLIAGLLRPDRGRIVLDGTVLDDTARGIHVPPHRRRIGLVFQHGRLFPHLGVAANLRYGERLLPPGQRRLAYAEVVSLLELGPFLARRTGGLSGGERQRVALGRALLASPRLLLLDEPLASLHAALKAQILPYLRRVRDELRMPFLYVSHDTDELAALCTAVLRLEHGAVVGPAGPAHGGDDAGSRGNNWG